jgi:hypothetical protein
MTAEDIHADNTSHARENVIHEAGLFQGRLGFERAIILLEEGCTVFSNIHGLSHISFPKGNMESAFEKIRHVLERENVCGTEAEEQNVLRTPLGKNPTPQKEGNTSEEMRHRKLKSLYGHLAGDYANFRVKDDGTEEPTGGTIRLTWQSNGTLKVQGFHSSGVTDWEGIIQMNLEFEGTGSGHYRHIGKEDSGTQKVTYWPATRSFTVLGANTTRTAGKQFVHNWRRIEKR